MTCHYDLYFLNFFSDSDPDPVTTLDIFIIFDIFSYALSSYISRSIIIRTVAYLTNVCQSFSVWSPISYPDLENWYQFYFGMPTIVSAFQINFNGNGSVGVRGPVGNIRLDYQTSQSTDPWTTANTVCYKISELLILF
jgi:hypothetical protein